MATYRFYLAPRLGDGLGHKTAWVAALKDHIGLAEIRAGFTFHNWKKADRTDQYFCLAFCDTSIHAKMDADTRLTALSPEFDRELDALAWLATKSDNDLRLKYPRNLEVMKTLADMRSARG